MIPDETSFKIRGGGRRAELALRCRRNGEWRRAELAAPLRRRAAVARWRGGGAGPLVVEPQQLRVYPLIALLSRVGDGLQGRQGGTHKEVFEAIDVEGRAGVESRGRLVDGELGKRELAVPVVLLSFA